MKEKEIEDRIRAVLTAQGWTVEKNHQTTLNSGRPDLHVGHPTWGEAWVEVKRPGGKLGARQFDWMVKWLPVSTIIVCQDESLVLGAIYEWHRTEGSGGFPSSYPYSWGGMRWRQWLPWCTKSQKARLGGADPLADALAAFGE